MDQGRFTQTFKVLAAFAAIIATLFAVRRVAVPAETPSTVSTLDRIDAFLLKRLLEENDIKCWLDVFDIRTSGKIEDDLFGIIKEHDVFVLLLSPNSVASGWVQQEIEVASSLKTLRLLPVILRPCDIPARLENVIGFDAREGLETPSLRTRLLLAINGSKTVQGLLLLDAAERELQNEKSLRDRAENQFPQLMRKLEESVSQPIRRLYIKIKLDSLPKDPDQILELSLKLDRMGYHGHMSIFIARYREGRTWPKSLGFEESPYEDYLLAPWPRIDVRYRWYSRTVKLTWIHKPAKPITDIDHYIMEFDGTDFQPREKLTLSQKFEIPSLSTLSIESFFRLLCRNMSGDEAGETPDGTDIWIEVSGWAGEQAFRLYRSHTTRIQRNILRAPYLSNPAMSPIIREALLSLYFQTSGTDQYGTERTLDEAIEKSLGCDIYDSDDHRRLAAYYEYRNARSLSRQGQKKAAQECYVRSGNLLWYLMHGDLLLEDVSILYLGAQHMMSHYLQTKRLDDAEYFLKSQLQAMEFAVAAKPEEPDFQRLLFKALFNKAKIDIALGRPHTTALESLCRGQDLLLDLYNKAPTRERRNAWIAVLIESIQLYHEWKVSMPKLLELWENALRPFVPGGIFEEAVALPSPPNELPVWLTDGTVDDWPTKEIKSASLRYTLRIPEWWSSEYRVRGTYLETEHLYYGRSDAEWLMVSFFDNVKPTWGDPRIQVRVLTGLNGGMPFMHPLDADRAPKLVPNTYVYLGALPSLVSKLNATEAHGYTGVTEVASRGTQDTTAFARYYLLIVLNGNFFWRITLSFETKLPPISLEKELRSDDHLRAGAILGRLRLAGPSEVF
ncbi:hypothetical protein H2202_002350 [Exophiala xenobiotica]|nr:hypothetical protein H2202_002350 [Exophiala xenobiotica]